MGGNRDKNWAQMPVTDVANYILEQRGQPMHFRDLIEEIIKIKPVNMENWPKTAAAIYTQLNLDTRFSYQGEGKWSLRVFEKRPVSRRRIRLVKKTKGKLRRLLLRRTRTVENGEQFEEKY